MALTSDQMDAFKSHASQYMGNGCLRCGNKSLDAVEVIGLNPPNQLGGQHVPCVVIACSRCGHVELIAARVAGVA